MKKNILIAGSILSATFLFTGCATILSGDNQSINLQSKKEQTVSINGQQYTSPNVISLERTDKDAVLKVKDCEKQILFEPLFAEYIQAASGKAVYQFNVLLASSTSPATAAG